MSDLPKSGKRFNIVIAVLLAALLWLYVVNVENPSGDTRISNVPVVVQGGAVLEARGLMVTDYQDTLDLKATGKRKTFLRLYRSDVTVLLDVSSITEPGEWTLTGRVVPDWLRTDNSISVTETNNFSITVTVKKQASKEVPVIGAFSGTMANGFEADSVQVSPSVIEVTGPEDVIAQISHAVVILRGESLKESISDELVYELVDEEGNPIVNESLICETQLISVTLPVVKVFEIPLVVELKSGGGATQEDVICTISPSTVTISGQEDLLAGISEISLGQINLAEVFSNKSQTFKIPIPTGAKNRNDITEATVSVSIESLPMKSITANQITLTNVPAGYTASLVTDYLQVWIRGEQAQLDQITGGQVRVVVDLSGINPTAGQQRAEAAVSLAGVYDAGIVGTDYSVAIKLEKS